MTMDAFEQIGSQCLRTSLLLAIAAVEQQIDNADQRRRAFDIQGDEQLEASIRGNLLDVPNDLRAQAPGPEEVRQHHA